MTGVLSRAQNIAEITELVEKQAYRRFTRCLRAIAPRLKTATAFVHDQRLFREVIHGLFARRY